MRSFILFLFVVVVGVACQIAPLPTTNQPCGCPPEPAPVFMSTNVDVTPEMRTIVMSPQGDTLVVHLPVAGEAPGRRITVKLSTNGFVDLHAAYSPALGALETIDGDFALMIEGAQGMALCAVTLEAWASNSGAGWIAVSSYP